jgi:hypothetical protein
MRYFAPIFQPATLAKPQTRLISKIGGIPWGIPPKLWPKCCGKPEKLLAQLRHDPPMLDLGQSGAVLHLFQCLECLGISNEAGRRAFIVDQSKLSPGLVTVPDYDAACDLGGPLIGEAFIIGWTEKDDRIPQARLPEFFDERQLWSLHEEFKSINWFDPREMSRFGGSPRWTGNGPQGFPRPPFEFLFQLDNLLFVQGKCPSADDVGCGVTRRTDSKDHTTQPHPGNVRPNAPWGIQSDSSNEYCFEFTNLGTDGTLYAFVNRNRAPYAIEWFWNR